MLEERDKNLLFQVSTDSSKSSPSQAVKKGPVKSLLKRTQVPVHGLRVSSRLSENFIPSRRLSYSFKIT